MTRVNTVLSLLLAFLLIPTINPTAAAQTSPDNSDEYDETSRVARISFLRNTVSLKRAGNNQWEQAALNLPLVEGDTIATENDARAEIQIDARNFVRLDGQTVLRVATLREEGIALSVIEGTASLRLARFAQDKEYFEIDAPGATLAAEKTGLYRLDVTRDGDVRASVRDGGRARVYSETSGFTLRDNRSAKLINGGSAAGDWELADAPIFDEWDRWADDRERYLAARLQHDQRDRYYDANVWGAEELDAYGDWSRHDQYGWVWRPHATVIRNYDDWAPYRYGRWRWCPPYGWTWVGDEPWGWAPYHHGRWVYVNNDWCWAPRGYGYSYRRSWWRPALVAFVYLPSSRGEYISWYPLGYGQRDPRSRHWQQNFGRGDRFNPLRRDEIIGLRRVNPIYQRAVNVLPARDFGDENARARAATGELARRAVTSDPVIGRLPVTPRASATIGEAGGNRDRISGDRGTRRIGGVTARTPLERPTGAAVRAPGVALGEELRRARVYQGREPRRQRAAGETREQNGIDRDAGSVGAVERRRNVTSRPELRSTGDAERSRDERAPLTRIPRPAPARDREARDASADDHRRNDERPGALRNKDERGASFPERNVSEPARPVFRSERPSPGENAERSDRERARAPRNRDERQSDNIGGRPPAPIERRERPERSEAPAERPSSRVPPPRPEYRQESRPIERPEMRERNERPTVRSPAREERPQMRESPPPARSNPAPPRENRERSGPARPALRQQ